MSRPGRRRAAGPGTARVGRSADADDGHGHGRVNGVNPGEVAERVIAVKLEYGLSVDARERGTR